jgi:5-methylcytosine-specific restriction endonuclease McrA
MFAYCVGRLHLSEDASSKRIQAARTAMRFPEIFEALAEGRLNLSAVCLLAPHLTEENFRELVSRATHRTNAQIREWLATRFAPLVSGPVARQLEVRLPQPSPRQVQVEQVAVAEEPLVPQVEAPMSDAAPLEYEMRFTMTREDHERFRHAQALLSHAIPSGDVAEIYRRAIEMLIIECEKRKIGVSDTPRTKEPLTKGRRVPSHVRRAVWERDGGRCTSVSPSGHRCGARGLLEFDHIVPVARGGASTVENVRLRCRSHNQEAAVQVFGGKFMKAKRARAAAAAEAERRDRAPWTGTRGP